MAVDDVYKALVILDDPDVLAATRSVDDLGGDLSLNDDERQIVQAIIDEGQNADEVSGFAAGAVFGALNYCSGGVSPHLIDNNPPGNFNFGRIEDGYCLKC